MNRLDISFEENPWQSYRMTLQMGDTVSALTLLTMLEGYSDEAMEEALQEMEEGCINLSLESLSRGFGSGEAALRLRNEAQLVEKGLSAAALEENDPLRLFLEEVAQTPAVGDEQLLAARCAKGDEKAMLELTNLGLSRVIEVAGEHTGYGVLLLDLIQEGSLGLWQAIRCFHGGDYTLHRDRWIRFYMAKIITMQARAGGVGQKLRSALEDYRAVDERLLGELGRNPTLEEIAEQLHMTVEETEAVRKMLENARMMNKARGEDKPEEDEEEADQAVENTALFQMRQRISDLLSGLNERDARLLSLRFGLDGSTPMGPEEAGRRLNMTAEEVVAAEAAALSKLRNR